jgi:hypothetical protein
MQSTMTRTQLLVTAATTALAFGQLQIALVNSILPEFSDFNMPVFQGPRVAASHRFSFGSIETFDQFSRIRVIETFARKILANTVDLDPRVVDAVNKRFWDLI